MKNTWTSRPLSEVCEIYQPKTISMAEMNPDGQYPVYGANGIIGRYNSFNHEQSELLVTCRGATCGSVNISEPKAWITGNAMVIRPRNNQVIRGFIEYFFRGGFDVSRVITGSAQPQITRQSLAPVELSFPPVELQNRIVTILDKACAGIAIATASAEKNLANARELFEATLSNILMGNSKGCLRYKLEDMVEANCTLSYGIVQPGEEVTDGLPIVRPTDLSRHVINLDGLKRINPTLAQGYSRTKLLGGELLLCVRGSTGGISIASSELAGGNVTRGIVPIRFSPLVVSQKLGYYLFLSKHVQDQIRAATYGTALMQINIRDLRQLTFIVPPPEDQPALLRRLESVAMDAERLKENYEQKLTELADLKQVIFQKAFSGKLTALSDKALHEELT